MTHESWWSMIFGHVDLWFMFHDLCIRGFYPESGISGKSWPLYIRISRNLGEEFMAELRALLVFSPEFLEKCAKVHGGRPWFRGRRPLYPRFCPGNPRKPRIQRSRNWISRIPRGNRGKKSYLALWRYLWRFSGDFQEIPGLEKVGFGLTALLFVNFQFWKFTKVHGVLEFRTFEEGRNPFVTDLALQRYFFQFQLLKSESSFSEKLLKLEASRGSEVWKTASATERSLWLVDPFSQNFSITLRLNWRHKFSLETLSFQNSDTFDLSLKYKKLSP